MIKSLLEYLNFISYINTFVPKSKTIETISQTIKINKLCVPYEPTVTMCLKLPSQPIHFTICFRK